MAMNKEQFRESCAAYVLGALEGEELREFMEALASADTEMRQIFKEMEWTALHMPLATETVKPSPRVRARVLESIEPEKQRQKESLFARLAAFLGFGRPELAFAISLVLAIGVTSLSYYVFSLREVLDHREKDVASLRSELKQEQQRFIALQDDLVKKTELLNVLQARRVDVVVMNGLDVNPRGYGKIIWDPERRTAILQISNLPPVPSDKDYQLWLIKDQKPISAGIFALTQADGEGFFKIENLAETNKKFIGAFAVTLEPKGGVLQPTGQMYLLGTPTL